MLEIVQNQQDPASPELGGDGVDPVSVVPGPLEQTDGPGDDRRHLIVLPRFGQVDEDGHVAGHVPGRRRQFQGQACLAHTGGPRQGHQSRIIAVQLPDTPLFLLTAEEQGAGMGKRPERGNRRRRFQRRPETILPGPDVLGQ